MVGWWGGGVGGAGNTKEGSVTTRELDGKEGNAGELKAPRTRPLITLSKTPEAGQSSTLSRPSHKKRPKYLWTQTVYIFIYIYIIRMHLCSCFTTGNNSFRKLETCPSINVFLKMYNQVQIPAPPQIASRWIKAELGTHPVWLPLHLSRWERREGRGVYRQGRSQLWISLNKPAYASYKKPIGYCLLRSKASKVKGVILPSSWSALTSPAWSYHPDG